jgi:hypothetical protein
MDVNKSFAIVASIFFIMFFGMFWIISISDAWINTPTNYSININMDNETRDAIERLSDIQYDTKCIVKEYDNLDIYDDYDDSYYQQRILVKEYLSTNCTIVE